MGCRSPFQQTIKSQFIMKTVCITDIPIGTKFTYDGEEFEVFDRDEYPFIEGKCISNPEKYDGHNLLFGNFEKVEVADETSIYKHTFVEKSKNYFVMKEELV